jgi:hypothetical protein
VARREINAKWPGEKLNAGRGVVCEEILQEDYSLLPYSAKIVIWSWVYQIKGDLGP